MDLHKALLRDVYTCSRCQSFGFTAPAVNAPFFKFPATIGATGHAPLLFVGINPRIDEPNARSGNRGLHEKLIGSKKAFADLACNRDGDESYIAPGCRERHYRWHMAVMQFLFGQDARFEDHAAVTELVLCASRNSEKLAVADSPCANRFFDTVFLKVRPLVVFCVWKSVLPYFQRRAGAWNQNSFLLTVADHTALVVYLPH